MKTDIKKSRIHSFVAFVSFFLVTSFFSIGQTWGEVIKLTAADAAADDYFGAIVSISGDKAIVGGAGNDDDGSDSGSAYIFELVGDTWVETQKLTASDAEASDYFGHSVSISGDRVIIGAYSDDVDGSNTGSAYIFELVGDTWVETQKLTASDAAIEDYFGAQVSLSGERAIIGSRNDDAGTDSGSAYIFELVGDTWVETQKLTASDAATVDYFGSSVYISGDVAIIGASQNDDAGDASGSAYIFELDGDTWIETQKLTASDAAAGDRFGISVSISGDRAIVGAYLNDDDGANCGSAYIFELDGDTWIETQKLTASDAAAGDLFGNSVSIFNDNIIVGARSNDDAGDASGSAYIFELDGDIWIETQKLTASDAAEGDRFGISVSISGDRVIVGAWGNDDAGPFGGSAYVFGTCIIPPTVTVETDFTVVCEGDTVTLSGEGATTYTWDGGLIDATPFVPPLGTTTYTVIGTDEEGCENTASVDIVVNELPIITATADDTAVCEGDLVMLSGEGAITYFWDGGVTDAIPFAPLLGITTYTVIGTDEEGCQNTASIDIVVFENIIITYFTTPEVFGGDAVINITVSGGDPTYSFDWDNDGTGDFDDDEDLIEITSGTYIVVIEDEAGCSGTETIEVSTQLGIDKLSLYNSSVFPNPTSDLVTIELEGEFIYKLVAINGNVLSTKNGVNKVSLDLSQLANGIYFLEIQSENGSETVNLVKR